jgi:hypothetical protein
LFARTRARQTNHQHRTWFPFLISLAGLRQTIIFAEFSGNGKDRLSRPPLMPLTPNWNAATTTKKN